MADMSDDNDTGKGSDEFTRRRARRLAGEHIGTLEIGEMSAYIDEFGARERLTIRVEILEISRQLREFRKAKNITPEDLVKTTGMTIRRLRLIESGALKGGPRLDELLRLFGACGVSLSFTTQDDGANGFTRAPSQKAGEVTVLRPEQSDLPHKPPRPG